MSNTEIVLSHTAEKTIEKAKEKTGNGYITAMFVLPPVIWLLFYLLFPSGWFFYGLKIAGIIFGEILLLGGKLDAVRERKKTIAQAEIFNLQDYKAVENFKKVLSSILNYPMTSYVHREPIFGDKWKPFSISINPPKNILHNMELCATGTPLEDLSQEELVKHSTILLLYNGVSNLRVILPSLDVTTALFSNLYSNMQKKVGHMNHLHSFFTFRGKWDFLPRYNVTHPRLIDAIQIDCTMNDIDDRKEVMVYGWEVQQGVVVASKVVYGGKEYIFIPTGLIGQIEVAFSHAKEKSKCIDTLSAVPMISQGKGTF